MADMNSAIIECFGATLSPQPDAIKRAEGMLKELATRPGYAISVLQVVNQDGLAEPVRLAAAVNFKNTMKHSWAPDAESEVQVVTIQPQEKDEVKNYIVTLMLQAPPSIRAQLSEALTIIATTDFPDKWKTLLPELREKLNTEDIDIIIGVLETISSVFKHFHTAYLDTSVNASLDYCQKLIAEPVLRIAELLGTVADREASNKAALVKLLRAVRLCNEVFHSLNTYGLSETMEAQMEGWMKLFHKWLAYSNPILKESDTDKEAADDAVKAAVCENINLFMQHNEDEVEPYLQTFVSDVWTLLMSCSLNVGQDRLAMTGIAFLTAVSHTVHHTLFSGQDVLKQICEGIVIPNIRMRDEDEETFDMNYVEYVRRDHEGSDNDTRRRAACDLVRCLTTKFPEQTTAMFSRYINALLSEYSASSDNWKAKDCALYLTMALAVKGKTAALGATTVNALVDVQSFFQTHVMPELASDINTLPVLKADALRFLTLFRTKLAKGSLQQAFPLLVQLLQSESNVVHSYAAIAIERLLALRLSGQALFVQADIAPFLEQLLTNLFAAFDKPDSATNEYIMMCVMRVISFVGPQIIPVAGVCMDRLTAMLLKVCDNPIFAGFNHYLFEAVAALVACTCADKVQLDALEARIFPCFNKVLSQDVQEFHPYVFQIFALLLSSHSGPAPEVYVKVMLAPFLQHFFWERKGNIPALTMLVQMYLQKAAPAIVEMNLLESVLGIFQKLLSMARHLQEAYALLAAVVHHVPLSAVAPYLTNILVLLFNKLTGATKSTRNSVYFITFVAQLACQHGGPATMAALDSVQPGSSFVIVQQVVVNNLPHVVDARDAKVLAVGLTRILCESPALLAAADNGWSKVLAELITFMETERSQGTNDDEVVHTTLEEMLNDSSEFSKLACAQLPRPPVLPEIADVRKNLATSLAQASSSSPGQLLPLVMAMPQECQAKLNEYLQAAGVGLA